ncbi:hypothetical protein Tel_15020 [Candidatus Tenderia electrophaga]|jgi:predicted porin|uniref:Porin domain-containing protein n=1 Tax=Candidatus Tenderia electrophaga TaxID=1748243 RepID=A0A0S2TGU6_9GAMM|nr:hypothetical protein Tel_15020 [Candidatus Tenderia electrophaga]
MFTHKKKCVTAVALALGLSTTAAADELTIYGSVGLSIEALDNTTASTTAISNNHSAFGIKGTKSIDENLTAVYLFDSFVGMDAGGGAGDSSLFGGGRDGWAGLSNDDWGIVALGFQGRPWKTSTNHLDMFGSTAADYSAIMGTTGDRNLDGTSDIYFDGGIGSSLIYFGPNINGFSWHLQYGADESDDGSNDFGGQFNYSRDALYASLSYDVDGQATGNDISATKLALTYTLKDKTVLTGMYDTVTDASDNSRNAYYFGVGHRINNTTVKLAFAMADDIDNSTDSGATYYALGVSHMLNNDLEVFALYSAIDNDTNGGYTYISAPHTTSNNNTAIAALGNDSNVVSAGIRYNFAWTHK